MRARPARCHGIALLCAMVKTKSLLSRIIAVAFCACLVAPGAAIAQVVDSITLFKRGGDEVDWCRDGRIAYASRGPDNLYGIHTCSATGGDDVWITKDNPLVPPGHKGSPCWHPSGRYILFVAEKRKHPGSSFASTPGLGSYSDLWIMTPNGDKAWQLTDTPLSAKNGMIIPKFSHDGKKVVWADRVDRARILAPKLTNIRTFRPGGEPAFNETYGFSVDDKSIIFCSDYNQKSFWTSQIFTCDAEAGQNIHQLTDGNYNEHACYSPDGAHIIWMTSEGELKGTDWWIMNADGSGKRQLTFFNKRGHKEFAGGRRMTCGLCSFSPDGKRFLGGIQNSLIKQTGDSYMVTLR